MRVALTLPAAQLTQNFVDFLCEVQGSSSEDFMNFAEMVFHQMKDDGKCPHCGATKLSWLGVSERVPEGFMQEYYRCEQCGKSYTKEFDIAVTFRRYILE